MLVPCCHAQNGECWVKDRMCHVQRHTNKSNSDGYNKKIERTWNPLCSAKNGYYACANQMPNHHDSRHGLPANSHLHERNRSPFEGQHVQNQTFVWFEIYCCKINRFSRWTALFWEQTNLNQMHGVESWTSECVNTYNISSKLHGGKQNSLECWEQKLGFGLTWSSTQFQNISNKLPRTLHVLKRNTADWTWDVFFFVATSLAEAKHIEAFCNVSNQFWVG